MNIGLAKGSGIATYGRNLIEGLNGASFESQILYGPGHNYAKRPILNEIALVDPVAAKGKKWRDRRELVLTPLGATARPVPISDNVVWPVRGGGRPKVQDFWSAPRLFGRADQWWGLTKGFTPVSFQASGDTRVPDIMHWTTVMPLKARGVANLYTIHDLIPLKLPHTTLDNKRRFMRISRDIARHADHIAVVSEATRRDVITLLGVPEDRVTNTWQAVSVPPKYLARTDEEVARELEGVFRLPWKGYFLWFGALEPKKNLARVVEAYLAANVDQPLVIDGSNKPYVILMVGVNGVGKTTTIGKLAQRFQHQGKSVMLAAGDTFRAAAVEQLQVWGERNNIAVVAQHTGADSASVIFDAVQAAKARGIDVLIADTAGRLHTKDNLMEELKKVRRVIGKLDDTAPHEVLLVLDAGTGQNAINQTKQFNQSVELTGLALTKLDGTAKGGVIFALAKQFGTPIRYIGVGEGIDDLRTFEADAFVDALFAEKGTGGASS